MKKPTANAASPRASSLGAAYVTRLKALVPEAFRDGGAVDFEVLRELLGDAVEAPEERYGLSWPGKRHARQLALTPFTGTLRPCPEDSVDWESTRNLLVEGDNLDALKLLLGDFAGQVKLIYIDPPYNTGKDLVYRDRFLDGAGHTGWLSMMYPRLKLARELLREDGALFVSIDDNEAANLVTLLKEIFGPGNLAGTFVWEKRRSRENRKLFSVNHEYVVCAARNKAAFEATRGLLPLTEAVRGRYVNPDGDPRGEWQSVAITAQSGHGTAAQFYTIVTPGGRRVDPPSGSCWRFTRERLDALIRDNRIWFGSSGNNVPRQKVFLAEQVAGLTPHTLWTADEVGTTDTAKRALKGLLDGVAAFETPKPVELIRRIIDIGGGGPDALVLDFFAGSGTTAEAVLRANLADGGRRRFVLVQRPEALDPRHRDQRTAAAYCDRLGRPRTIAELTRERVRRAAKRLREENPWFVGDWGFRVYKVGG